MKVEIISYFLVIVGWIVVHLLTVNREHKKEWREFSRDTVKHVDVILADAIKYHTSPERDKCLEQKIKIDIDYLDLRMQMVHEHLDLKCTVSFFRAAITLNNFETVNFAQNSQNNTLIRSIHFHALRIKEGLYKAN